MTMMKAIKGSVSIITLSSGLFCQTPPSTSTFDVASVKVHAGPSEGQLSTSGPIISLRSFSLMGLLLYSYSVKPYQLSNAALLDHTPYDIVAKAKEGSAPTVEEFKRMMQSLLEERFKLQLHREARDADIYALVIGKNGLKFKESTPDAKARSHFAVNNTRVTESMPKVTMAELADRITNNAGLDRPVLDMTGLTHYYALELTYTPAWRMVGRSESDPDILSIFAALQEQLGLKLEKQRALIEMLVVDHVEKPSEN